MKQILIFSVIFIMALGCQNNAKTSQIDVKDSTTVEFPESQFDFGNIIQGEQIKHTFKFKNTGDKPLIISEVHSSCGCTVADYSNKPINPQSEGYVKVTFNSSGKHGNQYKSVTIVSNTKPEKNVLIITGNVNIPQNQNNNQ